MLKALMGTMLAATVLSGVANAQTPAQGVSQTVPAPGVDPNAPVGKQAGTVMVRIRAIGVIPETLSSSISVIHGGVNVTSTAAPEVDVSYFFTDHLAAELIAASTRHELSGGHTALGHLDVGSVYVLPPTLTLQYHFLPQSRFSPYVGAGLTVAFSMTASRLARQSPRLASATASARRYRLGSITTSAGTGSPTST